MLKRRLLVLVAMLCLLGFMTSASADSGASCSCAMECRNGRAGCESVCTGGTFFEQAAKGALCCQQAEAATGPMECLEAPPDN